MLCLLAFVVFWIVMQYIFFVDTNASKRCRCSWMKAEHKQAYKAGQYAVQLLI
jgi:competence transcription factor ComK